MYMLVHCASTQDILIESFRRNKQIAKAFSLYLQYIEHRFPFKSLISRNTLEKDIFSDRIYIPLAHSN